MADMVYLDIDCEQRLRLSIQDLVGQSINVVGLSGQVSRIPEPF